MSQDEIVSAATELVESDGLARLSMPILARKLGCAVMSIYNYFGSKDELVSAVAHKVMWDIAYRLPPVGDGPWDEEIIAYFRSYRGLLRDISAYREMVLYAPTVVLRAALTPAQFHRLDAGIGILCRAGLTPDRAARVYNVCYNFTCSYVAQEYAARDGAASAGSRRPELGIELDPDSFPVLAALTDPMVAMGIDEDGFVLGLQMLVSGIATMFGLPRSELPSTGET